MARSCSDRREFCGWRELSPKRRDSRYRSGRFCIEHSQTRIGPIHDGRGRIWLDCCRQSLALARLAFGRTRPASKSMRTAICATLRAIK